MYKRFFKRPIDIFCALLAIIVFSWLYIIVAILVRIKLGSPVLFKQERPGKDGKIFKLYKFRTMTDEKDENGELLPDDVRLTKFGRLLRKTSLDELPEAFNILKGDMSVVGPRPLLVEYLPYYTEEETHRHDVRPGLTGLAQVKGRSFISWEEIFAYDLEYINKVTFVNDLKIVFLTAKKAFAGKDVADVTEAVIDENNRKHFKINGKEYVLHSPLNVERSCSDAKGDREQFLVKS
ncbi:MAG: sugar transferase [Oscillospiraceae bacterium]|nr:sugar transferase [Oscillospiraceae bacterium]